MAQSLSGKTVAILATDGVELVELNEPMKALKDAGAVVEIVSLKAGEFQGFDHLKPGDTVTADKAVAGVDASAYSALLLPGGVANPDLLRADADAVAVYADQPRALLGVGHIHAGELIPDRLLSPLEIQQILEGMSRPS